MHIFAGAGVTGAEGEKNGHFLGWKIDFFKKNSPFLLKMSICEETGCLYMWVKIQAIFEEKTKDFRNLLKLILAQ